MTGKMNCHSVRNLGSENLHHIIQHIWDSAKVSVWCKLMFNHIIGPFFFAESAVTKEMYLEIHQQFVVPPPHGNLPAGWCFATLG